MTCYTDTMIALNELSFQNITAVETKFVKANHPHLFDGTWKGEN
jgi:hypothetical protein